MKVTAGKPCQLGRENQGLLDDAFHEGFQLGGMGCGQDDAGLAGLQVLGQCPVGDSRVRVEQIILIMVGLTDGFNDLVIVVAVGMDVTADVLMAA